MDLVKTLRNAEIRVVNYRLFLLQLFMRLCLFVILFTFLLAGVSRGFETVDSLDFSGSGPLFLSDKQIQEDLPFGNIENQSKIVKKKFNLPSLDFLKLPTKTERKNES